MSGYRSSVIGHALLGTRMARGAASQPREPTDDRRPIAFMCYRLWIVSPLSLTEIRSMLPPGFSADIAPLPGQALRARLPGAQTVALLRIGGCACALQIASGGDDERHLRRRYAALGLSRDRIIGALDRHRRCRPLAGEPEAWRRSLAGFAAEHARNAGPTIYCLSFDPEPEAGPPHVLAAAASLSAAAVRTQADSWLKEGTLTELTR